MSNEQNYVVIRKVGDFEEVVRVVKSLKRAEATVDRLMWERTPLDIRDGLIFCYQPTTLPAPTPERKRARASLR